MAKRSLRVLAFAVVSLVVSSLFVNTVSESRVHPRPTYKVGTVGDGVVTWTFHPSAMPAGANVPGCQPSWSHPRPVVMVHGTLEAAAFDWGGLAPRLANEGFCVYTFNYGLTDSSPYYGGMTNIPSAASELRTFVDSVLQQTGAPQVDIVGHSQGGMMPRYYLKNLGGAPKVHTLVGLSPSNHGTTVFGLSNLLLGLQVGGVPISSAIGCISCTQQLVPSMFIDALNDGGETVPGPNYVVIQTKYDEVVTPYTSAFLSGPKVRNILLQDQCPQDYTEHIGITYDPIAAQDIIEALGRNRLDFRPECSLVYPVFSG
jgi:triacylglycerol esterase/lipase EstA (alpha/beta hydrolase family)